MAEHADERLRRRFITPEGVDLGLVLASAGERAAAFAIDAAIITATFLLATILLLVIGTWFGGNTGQIAIILWLLGLFVARNGYFILFEMGPRGATPGKRRSGLRVVARNGGRLTGDAVIARNLMREIELFLPLSFWFYQAHEGVADAATALFGLGWSGIFLFFPLMNRDRLRVGDLLAGTWVVRAPKTELDLDLIRIAARPRRGPAYSFTDAQLDAYGVYELQTLEDVLRANDWATIQTVAEAIRTRIGWQAPGGDSEFLNAYYTALRLRLERNLLFGRRRENKFDRR
ncbi:RDD domain-containing protein [Sphingomonas sp. MM-1]|uniref:RDD family protein n=1 Tax=Sphingomonas sp. MM-1 TaxID=745310 RepID=UPI0002C11D35|nr:RDD family protein [Sphingomonas sp. MM-1]AGH50553.1 RDD domain-containing protein [Sphingomonas sp. MM-1]